MSMSNVDKYREEIHNALMGTAQMLRPDWTFLEYRLRETLERALAEQREGIAEEIISRNTSVNDIGIATLMARVARNYGKEQK